MVRPAGASEKPSMDLSEEYGVLVSALAKRFGDRLRLVVLFGSRSRGEARPDSDHDLLVVIDGLPKDPLARQRETTAPLLPELLRLPERVSLLPKTPEELMDDLSPLLVDVCVDGVGLYGDIAFAALRRKVLGALQKADLTRRRIAGTWMWMSPTFRKGDWALTWEG